MNQLDLAGRDDLKRWDYHARIVNIASMVRWLCTEECFFSAGAVFDRSGG